MTWSESEGPRTRGVRVREVKEDGWPSSSREKIPPSSAFVLCGPWVDCMMPTQPGKANLLRSNAADSNANLFRKHPRRRAEIACYQLSGYVLAQTR